MNKMPDTLIPAELARLEPIPAEKKKRGL